MTLEEHAEHLIRQAYDLDREPGDPDWPDLPADLKSAATDLIPAVVAALETKQLEPVH